MLLQSALLLRLEVLSGEGLEGWTGGSGHAGHLTGCGGQPWTERWLNGSGVGRLQGTAEVGDIRTGGLVTDTAG